MNNKLIFQWIYQLSIPLGSKSSETKGIFTRYLIGSRNKYVIIDPKIIYFYIKKTVSFVKKISNQNLKMLFVCEQYNNFDNDIILNLLVNSIYKKKHSCIVETWSGGLLTNYQTHFSDVFKLMFPVWKKKTNYTLYWLIIKLFFFSKKTKLVTNSWAQHFIFLKKYWKFFTYFKYYLLFNKLPNVCVYHNTVNNIHPVVECEHLKIPSVGVVDTDASKISYTYFIPGNDKSIIIGYLIFTFIINTYKLYNL